MEPWLREAEVEGVCRCISNTLGGHLSSQSQEYQILIIKTNVERGELWKLDLIRCLDHSLKKDIVSLLNFAFTLYTFLKEKPNLQSHKVQVFCV